MWRERKLFLKKKSLKVSVALEMLSKVQMGFCMLESKGRGRNSSAGDLSPDGQRVLFSDDGNLYVLHLGDDRTVAITKNLIERAVSNSRAVWSPDGTRIAFVQADASGVRTRPVLVRSDPSYPGVRETRFARVGETIATLRVGVVDAEASETRWLAIPQPEEGYYLGQVS